MKIKWQPVVIAVWSVFMLCATADIATFRLTDPRNLRNGTAIPSKSYCDQPYVVSLTNGAWVCVMTTGDGLEGQQGQHIVSCVSTNRGASWSELTAIEPADGPEASWATPLLTPYGRIYVFYVYNGDQVKTLPGSTMRSRTDMLGWYCYRYSDDNGHSWSSERYRIPIPLTACDLTNQWGGEVQIFWGIDKPEISNGSMFFAFTKLGRYMLEMGEGWIVRSDNILTERDPSKLQFDILPTGDNASQGADRSRDRGIRNPAFGSVQEEFNLIPLKGDDLLCVFRTTRGFVAQSRSADGGLSWSMPEPMTYTPGGRVIKMPRACPKLFRTSDGRYLLWYHNHGGRSFRERNPVFLSGGVLNDDKSIYWSEPELVFFDPDLNIRVSYPDLIEADGDFWLTETQKSTARLHKLDRSLLEGMWRQNTYSEISRQDILVESTAISNGVGQLEIPAAFGSLDNGGFSVECWFDVQNLRAGEELFNTVGADGRGVRVVNREHDGQRLLQIELCDGARITAWSGEAGITLENRLQHVVFVCDYSAGIIAVVHNGRYCDGGQSKQYGWGRIPLDADAVRGTATAKCSTHLKVLRLYGRPLRTSEVIGNFRAGY